MTTCLHWLTAACYSMTMLLILAAAVVVLRKQPPPHRTREQERQREMAWERLRVLVAGWAERS